MLYVFDDCVLDLDRRELRRDFTSIAIEPQVFDLLEYLIRHRERVVSRDELIEAIWGGRIVSELALTTRISAVRSAVGDSGTEQRLIKTLPRKGIRFVGEVREEQEASEEMASPSEGTALQTIEAVPADGSTSVWQVIDDHSDAPPPPMVVTVKARAFAASRAAGIFRGNRPFVFRSPDLELFRAIGTNQREYRDGRQAHAHRRTDQHDVARRL